MHIRSLLPYAKLIWAVIVLSSNLSCKKFVQVRPSPDIVPANVVFESDESALAAASQVYIYMRASTQFFTNGGLTIAGGLSADELTLTFSLGSYQPFLENSLTSTESTLFVNFWSTSYKNLYIINSVIQGVSTSDKLSPAIKNQILGEMMVVRSWYYFYLINLFGDVPLILATDYRKNALIPRTPKAEVYQQLIKDLQEAENLLNTDYPSNGKVRPNKFTAAALLSRIYLFIEDWTNAEAQASLVINSNKYGLVSDLNQAFLINSEETIWEVASDNEIGNTVDATMFIPYSNDNIPVFILTDVLVNAFETNDLRKELWVGKNTTTDSPPQDFYYPLKYKNNRLSGPSEEFNTILRLDELYLIRAEARAHVDLISAAQVDLNLIRSRAGLPSTTPSTTSELLDAIGHERQVELFMEWGHRWLDLKRTHQADIVLTAEKGSNWQATDELYPIPQDEILRNPNLTQNEGY